MSTEKRSSAVVPREAGVPSGAAPAARAVRPEPSIGRRFSSSDWLQMRRASAITMSAFSAANCRDSDCSARRSSGAFSAATSRCPVRICVSPKNSVA